MPRSPCCPGSGQPRRKRSRHLLKPNAALAAFAVAVLLAPFCIGIDAETESPIYSRCHLYICVCAFFCWLSFA